jgi:hypothetical protein
MSAVATIGAGYNCLKLNNVTQILPPIPCGTFSGTSWNNAPQADWDNIIGRISTDSGGNITSSLLFFVQEVLVATGNSWMAYTAVVTGTGPGGPVANAVDDGPITVTNGVAKIISVGSNDSGFTNPVTVTVTTLPTQGTITAISPPGPAAGMTITYTSNIGAIGADSFVYAMTDGRPASDSATVTLTINRDTDGDGVLDQDDNCTTVANTLAGNVPGTAPPIPKFQLDSDSDGYGNACDADLNNTGLVTAADFAIQRSVFNENATESPTAAAADLNGSGQVTAADFGILRGRLNMPPGPSGLHP